MAARMQSGCLQSRRDLDAAVTSLAPSAALSPTPDGIHSQSATTFEGHAYQARISPGIEAASRSWLRWVFASQNSGQILGVRRKAEAYEQALAIDGPCHSDHYSKLRRATIDCPSAVSKVSQNCPSPPLGLKICHMAIGQPGLKEVQKKEQQRQAAGLSIVAGSRFQPL
jgi:hypothetical protein